MSDWFSSNVQEDKGTNRHTVSRPNAELGLTLADIGIDYKQSQRAQRIDYGKAQADHYIQASELRPKLAKNLGHEFTQWQMLELCKCETEQDAKRVAKKAIARAKKNGKLSKFCA